MALASRAFDSLRSYLGSLTWAPLVDVSRRSVLSILRRIEVGKLLITDVDGIVFSFGEEDAAEGTSPITDLKILKEAFWVRLLLFADMVRMPPQAAAIWTLDST